MSKYILTSYSSTQFKEEGKDYEDEQEQIAHDTTACWSHDLINFDHCLLHHRLIRLHALVYIMDQTLLVDHVLLDR